MSEHTHRFDLQLGADGRGRIYGDYEGYVHRCKCGFYAPDYIAWRNQREADELASARALVAKADR